MDDPLMWPLLLALTYAAEPTHFARATGRIPVRAAPEPTSAIVGWLLEDAVFEWTAPAEGPGCESATWASLAGGGFACLTSTTPDEGPAERAASLVRFDPPRPEEWEDYLETGSWPRDPETTEALLPFVYGKRWRQWKAPLYASVEAFIAGEDPVGRLTGARKAHFVAVVETEDGGVLVRDDGQVAPIAETHIYPVDRFVGRDLVAEPAAEGWLAAWVTAYAGAEVRDEAGETVGELAYHAAIDARTLEDGTVEVRGDGLSGVLARGRDVQWWRPTPAPEGVGDQLWLDVDLDQQVLALRVGEQTRFATLISGGLSGPTPRGLFTVLDKSIHDDMASLPDSAEPYFVEEVPWVVHFKYRYAIHAAYWHWGFGHRASHGCINLSPRDARIVFDAVGPVMPAGWHTVVATEPGTVVRVRQGDRPVPDRR